MEPPIKYLHLFYKKGCLSATPPRMPLPKPKIKFALIKCKSLKIDELNLLPNKDWDQKIMHHWNPGELSAQKTLKKFLDKKLKGYKEGRNYPEKSHTSRLSPFLHFGEISPNQVWYATKKTGDSEDHECFLSELGWREFSYALLYHNPTMPYRNLYRKFDDFPWKKNTKLLKAWQKGETGYPIIDAAMKQLWETGYMHNRLRMIVASFLVKNLLVHWHHG